MRGLRLPVAAAAGQAGEADQLVGRLHRRVRALPLASRRRRFGLRVVRVWQLHTLEAYRGGRCSILQPVHTTTRQ